MALPAAVAAANPPITFDVYIGDSFMLVSNSNSAPTNVRIRDKDGNIKATGVLPDDEFFFRLPAGVTVEIGDRIRASDGTFTRKFTVPNMSVTVDRVTDRAHGTGPAQRTIKVGWAGRFGDVFEDHGVRVRAGWHRGRSTFPSMSAGVRALPLIGGRPMETGCTLAARLPCSSSRRDRRASSAIAPSRSRT